MRFMKHYINIVTATALMAGPVFAQDLPVDSIIVALLPENAGPVISGAAPELTRGIKRSQPLPEVFDFPKVEIIVSFEGDTHRLTEAGMRTLRSVAEAISDPQLDGSTFQVASYAYLPHNLGVAQTVSSRRASTAVEHLVTFYGIERQRLVPVGYGATDPADLAVPTNPLNQRTALINITKLNQN